MNPEKMNLDNLLLMINGIAYTLIALRLLAFRRGENKHCYGAAIFAFCVIAASGTVAIRLALGAHAEVDPAEVFFNVTLCIGVFMAKGNIKRLASFSGVKKSEVIHE